MRRELEKIESGGVFQHFNITNFLEGDLFAWYLPIWSEPIDKLVRDMVSRLDGYNPGTLSEDPAISRDLLKKMYHQLFPRSVRHDLGEYYTPDWLAELVIDELEYEGDPDKRLLDPACGSGTFLVVAINRIRHWYEANREACRYDEGELCRKILANVVGFDLNPLAVMAARTNYLIAIRGLLSHAGQAELPVYLCDSILTPSEYGERRQKEILGRPMQLQTAAKPTPFFIPREVTTDRGILARYSNLLAELSPVRSGYTAQEFLDRLADEGLPREERDDHLQLFEELRELDRNQKNGVWAWIIKNAFAPLFVQRVDYVAGNPPWVNWESLPDGYRDTLKPIWQRYGLFTLSGSAGARKTSPCCSSTPPSTTTWRRAAVWASSSRRPSSRPRGPATASANWNTKTATARAWSSSSPSPSTISARCKSSRERQTALPSSPAASSPAPLPIRCLMSSGAGRRASGRKKRS